jgi:hypothetical protein
MLFAVSESETVDAVGGFRLGSREKSVDEQRGLYVWGLDLSILRHVDLLLAVGELRSQLESFCRQIPLDLRSSFSAVGGAGHGNSVRKDEVQV